MKYHIFIGSTMDGLKNERKESPGTIMELGRIPVSEEKSGRKKGMNL
jgi:hypothetical protein